MAYFMLRLAKRWHIYKKSLSCLLSLDNGFSPSLMDKTELLVTLAPYLMLHYSEASLQHLLQGGCFNGIVRVFTRLKL